MLRHLLFPCTIRDYIPPGKRFAIQRQWSNSVAFFVKKLGLGNLL